MGSSVLSQLRKKNRYVGHTFIIKKKETNERPISLTKNKTSSKPETKKEVSYTPPLLLEKTKIPDNKTTQDTTSTTPTTKGFANKLSSILKNDKSSWEQFPQLIEHITTIPRNNFLRHDKIIGEITDDIICENLISLLDTPQSKIKTLKDIISVIGEIHITTYDLYTQFYISWVVIGCPVSTDIDVVVFVTKENIKDGKPLELSPTLLITLMTELRDAGYSIESINDLDINVLCVNESGHIIANAKGGAEIANIINLTHQYHKQKYPIHYLQTIEVSIFDKLRAISKFILDKLKNLTQDYEKIRSSKQEAYQNGTDAMILFTVSEDFLGNLDLVNINNTKEWKDLWKSLTMKFCQLILLVNKQYEYTKEQLAKKTGKLFPELENLTDELLWFLFRGNKGCIDNTEDTIRFLHQKYCEIVANHFASVKPTYMTITKDTLLDTIIEQELHFPEDLLKAFFESPNVPTSTFEKLWDEFVLLYKEVYNVSSFSLNKLFQTPVSSLGDRLKLFTLLGKTNYEQFVWIAQRSDEWFALRKLYPGGTDLGNIGETLQAIYNLIRGSITEMIIQELFSPSVIGLKNEDYSWIDTGLIHNAKKSCAPDGLLVSSTDIIPVEIKSLHSTVRNSDYYRGIKLATKQCNSVRTILNRPDVITHYLVILSWYKPDGSLELELHYKEF